MRIAIAEADSAGLSCTKALTDEKYVEEMNKYSWTESNQEIIAATKAEQELLFPDHVGGDRYCVAKTPCVYKATPVHQQHRTDQTTLITNVYLTGDYTMQRYLASMEGAVLSGKLTARVIASSDRKEQASDLQMPNFQPATNAATA